ncbi:hypothetical protein BU24DRAFT_423956 [Aaosphaeria arxii CBS 175.79]|uniref:Uncharacterized protein n=1 Tax=Aaosphaeria arxii CBS 175.79 TaxID=1450172 RepID=A0A6A5XPH3_9PLEO|nr:uncharacterized protein BU24DRAFT_423956 [Aaosphaeria arxii CBS 175.79]KAF2015042.1 hypothetical protein BU24DRAFT_423956 [Aaosphaeria arxii CBS 175.79]
MSNNETGRSSSIGQTSFSKFMVYLSFVGPFLGGIRILLYQVLLQNDCNATLRGSRVFRSFMSYKPHVSI